MASAADRLAKKLDAHIERAAKALIIEIARELKRSTPVDTGHARANWIPSIGSPNTAEDSSGALAQAGAALVAAYKLSSGKLFVTNVVPYIRRLNEGSSTQAPALFVESAVKRAVATIRSKTGVDFSSVLVD